MKNKKILIVDYDKDSVDFLNNFLQAKGFKITVAPDGLSGLNKFKKVKPDLVILEALLPKIHGFELCKKIVQKSDKKVPVIIVTGVYTEIQWKNEAIHSYGASDYFKKPIQEEDLINTIFNLLEAKKREELDEDEISIEKRDLSIKTSIESKANGKEEEVRKDEDIEKKLDEILSDLGIVNEKEPRQIIEMREKNKRKESKIRHAMKNKEILIVDDDKVTLRMLEKILSNEGYSVMEANNGKDAIKIAKNQIPNLIILDIMMPGMDGGDVANVLKSDFSTGDIPIIFLSSLIKRTEEKHIINENGKIFIGKPINRNSLLEKIRIFLG